MSQPRLAVLLASAFALGGNLAALAQPPAASTGPAPTHAAPKRSPRS